MIVYFLRQSDFKYLVYTIFKISCLPELWIFHNVCSVTTVSTVLVSWGGTGAGLELVYFTKFSSHDTHVKKKEGKSTEAELMESHKINNSQYCLSSTMLILSGKYLSNI